VGPAGAGLLAVLAIGVWPVSLQSMADARTTRLHGKACMEFAGVLEDLPGLRTLHPRLVDLRERIVQIDRGGYFSPRLVRSLVAQDLAGDPSATCGVFERLERNGGSLVAVGHAELPSRHAPPDAVLLAFDRADGTSTIFALSTGARTWRVPFAASKLPPDAVSVSAWAFDAAGCQAFRLSGSPRIAGR